jgi:phosphatidate cytidylyltransferase
MKKLVKRLLIFSLGLPALLSLVIFFPQYNHLLLNAGSIIFSVLGAVEFRNILLKKNLVISVAEAIVLGAISPAAWTVVVSFGVMGQIVPGAFILGASWLLVSGIFSRQKFDS